MFRDEIYVFGRSFNDDPDVIGGPPLRVYFNEVWKSRDGQSWQLLMTTFGANGLSAKTRSGTTEEAPPKAAG